MNVTAHKSTISQTSQFAKKIALFHKLRHQQNVFSNDIWNDCINVYTILNCPNPTGIQISWQLHGNEASGVREVFCDTL